MRGFYRPQYWMEGGENTIDWEMSWYFECSITMLKGQYHGGVSIYAGQYQHIILNNVMVIWDIRSCQEHGTMRSSLHYNLIQVRGFNLLCFFCVLCLFNNTYVQYAWCSQHRQRWFRKIKHQQWMVAILKQSYLIDTQTNVSTLIFHSYFDRPSCVYFWDVSLKLPVSNQEYIDQKAVNTTWYTSFVVKPH